MESLLKGHSGHSVLFSPMSAKGHKQTSTESPLEIAHTSGTTSLIFRSSAETSTLWQLMVLTMTYEESGKPTASRGNLASPGW